MREKTTILWCAIERESVSGGAAGDVAASELLGCIGPATRGADVAVSVADIAGNSSDVKLAEPLRGKRWVVGSGNHGYWLGNYEQD